jgi:hypothetical protein
MSGTRANPRTTHDNAGIAAWRFKLNHEIGSFDDCRDAYFGADEHAKWREGFGTRDLIIGPNMYVRATAWRTQVGIPTAYAVVLYDTEVIRYYDDGTFSVDCGGHATSTTRERLNGVVPDGFGAYFHDHRLGLFRPIKEPVVPCVGRSKKPFAKGSLWPLDHGVIIEAATGRRVGA